MKQEIWFKRIAKMTIIYNRDDQGFKTWMTVIGKRWPSFIRGKNLLIQIEIVLTECFKYSIILFSSIRNIKNGIFFLNKQNKWKLINNEKTQHFKIFRSFITELVANVIPLDYLKFNAILNPDDLKNIDWLNNKDMFCSGLMHEFPEQINIEILHFFAGKATIIWCWGESWVDLIGSEYLFLKILWVRKCTSTRARFFILCILKNINGSKNLISRKLNQNIYFQL